MGDFIQMVEGSAIATFVRESPSIFAYTTVLSLHAMGLAVVVGIGGVLSLRLMGVAKGLPVPALLKLYPVMWIGFTVNALSGLALLAANLGGLLENVLFLIKLALILFAVINMELLRSRLADDPPPVGEAAEGTTKMLAISALVLWLLVIVAGRFTAYPYFVSALFS